MWRWRDAAVWRTAVPHGKMAIGPSSLPYSGNSGNARFHRPELHPYMLSAFSISPQLKYTQPEPFSGSLSANGPVFYLAGTGRSWVLGMLLYASIENYRNLCALALNLRLETGSHFHFQLFRVPIRREIQHPAFSRCALI